MTPFSHIDLKMSISFLVRTGPPDLYTSAGMNLIKRTKLNDLSESDIILFIMNQFKQTNRTTHDPRPTTHDSRPTTHDPPIHDPSTHAI